jgi:hypothetical protein
MIYIPCSHAKQHRFDVRDSIQMTTFNEPSELERDPKTMFSPNGKHFALVTSRGLIDSNAIQSTLWIYDTETVRSFLNAKDPSTELKPRSLATAIGIPVATTLDSYSSLITDVRWSPDSQMIYFRKQDAASNHLLYRVNTRGSAARRLTPRGYDVQTFDVKDSTVACTMSRPIGKSDGDRDSFEEFINPDANAVTGLPLAAILFPQAKDSRQALKANKLWVARKGRPGHILNPVSRSVVDTGVVDMLSLSPKGHWGVQLIPTNSIPASWAKYEPSPVLPYLRIDPKNPYHVSPRNVMRLKEYSLIDLDSGNTKYTVNAPNARPLGLGILDQAVWSSDERRLLLTNTFLPLADADEKERSRRLHACVVADIELPSLKVSCITFSRVPNRSTNESAEPPWLRSVAFGKDKDEAILRYSGLLGTMQERYQLRGEDWVLEESFMGLNSIATRPSSVSGAPVSGLEVTIRQTLNASPTLWAEDIVSGRSIQLWNPNPQLALIMKGQSSIYHWNEWTGGLIKPVDYVPGKRYPLVIQTHGFENNIFKLVTDGAYPTAMAARPLASAGIMVLQIPDRPGKDLVTSDEAERHVEGYLSAIAQLDSDGLIDPKHVGIIGFSRTCLYVESALIEYPNTFAAATIADGVDESYMQYHLFTGDPSWEGEFEKINQARPFGEEGLKKWMKLAPGFHLDRVETPLRIETIGPISILREWEIYSSLWEQNKPVDLIYIPDGQHILQKPLDRLASEQGNVDWFRFWLQGCEEQAFDKRPEYQRWEGLRKLQPIEPMPCTSGTIGEPQTSGAS